MKLQRYDVHLAGVPQIHPNDKGAYMKVEDLEKFLGVIDRECGPNCPLADHSAYVMGGELEDLLDGHDMDPRR